MKFDLDFIKTIYKIGFLLTLTLILVDLLTFFFYPNTVFSDIFLATREQTPLTWISALAFFFIALSCFAIYYKKKSNLWYLLSLTFFFFSVDDAVYMHERISGFFVDNTSFLSSFPSYTWTIIYFPILAFSLFALLYIVWKDGSPKNKKMVVSALLILSIAVLLDFFEGLTEKDSVVFCFEKSCNLIVLHIMRLTEEVLEAFALGLLGYTNIVEHLINKK